MALLQPICSWRPGTATNLTRPVASCTERGLKTAGRCSSSWSGPGERDDGARTRAASGLVVKARRGSGGAGESRIQRSSTTSRGPSKQQEASRSSSQPGTSMTKKTKQEEIEDEDENGLGEDALEALFAQLEMDLEAGGISDNEDLTEDDFIELENELAAALSEIEDGEGELLTTDLLEGDDDNLGRQKRRSKVEDDFDDVTLEEFEDDDEEQRVVNLEPWQLRKLAAAVEIGRRKVNIKALSAEVGLDRFDVLAWLKDPPPELLMYSATINPEEIAKELPVVDLAKTNSSPSNSTPTQKHDVVPNSEGKRNWHSQKRLRKEHEATFERVYRNTDRPSNAIIQNLVELTHVPRKRIVDWFGQRRQGAQRSPKFEALR